MIGWVFFSIEKFSDAMNYIKILFSFDFHIESLLFSNEFYFTLFIAVVFSFIGILGFGKRIQLLIYREINYSVPQALTVLIVAVILYGVSASYITATGFNPFIYFRF